MYKFVALLAFVAVAHGMVRREAPAGSTQLQDLEKHAQEFQKEFSKQLNSLASSKNTQELQKALKDGSDSVLQQISVLSSSLQSALVDANGKAKEALEKTRAELQKTAEQLRAAHPDVEAKAHELRDTLVAAVQGAAGHSERLAKEVAANLDTANQKLAPKIKEAYEAFAKNAAEVQKKIAEAAKQ
ncbi:apolipophorin-3 [Plutella xylostella]|uniref:apolipophorin-3 n=1 Tax=Plutella xylostella TaxID=51655 RepID=UPI0020331B51|nr:apolipophorin-3 [Plutella xylostella]